MSKIKARCGNGNSKRISLSHKDLHFYYYRPCDKDIKRDGRMLHITSKGPYSACLELNGTQINTIKKILKAVGEI